jgi:hypothetical protein
MQVNRLVSSRFTQQHSTRAHLLLQANGGRGSNGADNDGSFHFDMDGLNKLNDSTVDNQLLLTSFERDGISSASESTRQQQQNRNAYRHGPLTATSSDHGYSTMNQDENSDKGRECLRSVNKRDVF